MSMISATLRLLSRKVRITPQFLWGTLGLFSLYFIGLYLFVALSRIHYPFELEWMEGGMVDHIRRVLSGRLLYGPPSLEFGPVIYPPLYFYIGAAVSLWLGVGFLPLRLVSLLASLGCFGIIFQWVRKETGKVGPGLFAAGLYAATFPLSGAWFDIARVDSLFLFLLLGALYWALFADRLSLVLLSALTLTLAGLTKQTGFFMAAPLTVYFFFTRPKYCFFFMLTAAAWIGGSHLVLNQIHAGWYQYYLFEVPHQHEIYWKSLRSFWRNDLLQPMGIACGFGCLYLIRILFKTSRQKAFFYWTVGAGMLTITALSRAHSQAYRNVLFPAYALIAILAALGITNVTEARSSTRYPLLSVGALGLLAFLQMSRLLYVPTPQIPTARDRQAGARLVELIHATPGEILLPYHGFLPTLAGKATSAQAMAVFDIVRVGDQQGGKLIEKFRQAVRTGRFEMIIVDHLPGLVVFEEALKTNYHKTDNLINDPSVFWPVTGSRFRPQEIYRKNA